MTSDILRPLYLSFRRSFWLMVCIATAWGPAALAGSFVVTGSLNTARCGHTATLLTNGLVLVVGGENVNASVTMTGATGTAELYNPATGQWTYTGSLNFPRANHTATLLLSGQVLVAGGDDTTNYLNSCELYNPNTGLWTTTGPLNNTRRFHSATLLPDGSVLAAGGYNGSVPTYPAKAEIYQPATGTWTNTGSISRGRDILATVTLFNGSIVLMGGAAGSSIYTNVDSYDKASGLWSAVGPLSVGRDRLSATLLRNGLVLAAGGNTPSGVTNSAELYNPATQQWSATGAMVDSRRAWHSATLLMDGTVLVAGGNLNSSSAPTNTAAIYDPNTGVWTGAGLMAAKRSEHTATLLPDGRVLIAGGYNGTGLTGAELYQGPAPAPSPIVITNATAAHGGPFQFSFTNQTGGLFSVSASSNLTDWAPLGNAFELLPGFFHFSDASGINQPQRFYRVQAE